MLILLRGKPGTGKSTFADALGRRLGAAVIDKDDVKDVLDARYRDEHIGGLTYDVMLKIAERCLRQGIPVICDSPLTFPDLHAQALEITARHGVPALAFRTVCSDREEWKRRIEDRRMRVVADHRISDFADPRLFAEERYTVKDEIVIDTTAPLEACIEIALAQCAAPQPA